MKAFDGAALFELKATHGFPLDFAIDRITEAGVGIDWNGFVEAARMNGWWDFQTYEVVSHALEDAGLPPMDRDSVRGNLRRFILACPHPQIRQATIART